MTHILNMHFAVLAFPIRMLVSTFALFYIIMRLVPVQGGRSLEGGRRYRSIISTRHLMLCIIQSISPVSPPFLSSTKRSGFTLLKTKSPEYGHHAGVEGQTTKKDSTRKEALSSPKEGFAQKISKANN